MDSCIILIQKIEFDYLVINSINIDSIKLGYDLELIEKVSSMLYIPIVQFGEVRKILDFVIYKWSCLSSISWVNVLFQGSSKQILN